VKRLKHLALEGRTIIASIHQPSGDVFKLFDFLYLLCNGKTVYFGPAQQAQEVKKSSAFLIKSLAIANYLIKS
jgi:ABC-type multidrug transport system ATPase subunit